MLGARSYACWTLLTSLPRCAASFSTLRNVVVVGGTHGNEYTGVWVIKSMDRTKQQIRMRYPSLNVSTLLANPEAHMANKRFVDEDLNRQFSKDALLSAYETDQDDGLPRTVESYRAQELNELLGPKFSFDDDDNSNSNNNDSNSNQQPSTDVIIDLHTTTTNMGVTVIVAEGDELMTQAAAYVMKDCQDERHGSVETVRCLLHTHPTKDVRPNLCSTGRHGFTIEVGPVPQGVIRHDIVEKTERVLYSLLRFLERRNQNPERTMQELTEFYATGRVPCFRSALAQRPGEMSGKIVWPTDDDNPNFPKLMVHKNVQDRDFMEIRTGDPLFVDLEGNTIPYNGSHGSPVHLIFINEAGYYYKSSGTGIGVAVKAEYDVITGTLVEQAQMASAFANGMAPANAPSEL